MNTITIKTLGRATRQARRRRQVVILRSLDLSRRYSPFAARSASAHSNLRRLLRAACRTLSRAALWSLRAVFSDAGCVIAAVVLVNLMLWHAAGADTLESQRLIAVDILCSLPWLIAFFLRTPQSTKGGAR